MDDVALVQRATAFDKDAFGVVYERYAARLYDYLWWVLQDRDEATHALYDTFLEAGARMTELRDPTKLRPWLFAVASDQALRHGGRRAREAARDDVEEGPESGASEPGAADPPAAPASGAETAWGELVHVVQGVAADLSPQNRALLDLRFRQGLEEEELAEAVGTSPEHAAELLEDLSDRVETLLGETVVAFLAQRDCPTLTELLGPWDTHLDANQRELVEEHAEECTTCGERRRRRIPASALLGVSPAVALPGGVGERVLEDVDLAAHHGRRFAARRNGFPPPLIGDPHAKRLAIAGAAAAVLVVLGAAAFLVSRESGTERVASVGNVEPATTRLPTTVTSLAPTSSTSSSSVPGEAAGIPGVATTRAAGSGGGGSAPAGGGGGGTGGGGTGGGGNGGTNPDVDPGPQDTAPPETAPPETAPPTTAPDTTGPTISALGVSPSVVRAGSRCTNSDAAQATVTVRVTDPSGISEVAVTVAGPSAGRTPMTSTGGGSYTAVIGPFDTPLPAGVDFPAQVVVQAKDGAGNTSATSTPLTIRCSA